MNTYMLAVSPDRETVRRELKSEAAALRKVARLIRAAARGATSTNRLIAATLADAAEFLVEDILTAGVLAHLDPSLRDALEPSAREWSTRRGEALKPDRLYGTDHLTKGKRIELAQDFRLGPELIARLLDRVTLAIEAATIGAKGAAGRRRHPERDFLIGMFATWWQKHHGPLQGDTAEEFRTLCENAFETLGISTRGIEKRVARVVDEMDAKN